MPNGPPESALVVAVDTGGTFTDGVARTRRGELVRVKVPSTPDDPSRAIADALEALRALADSGSVRELRHGTTVATNALLERRGAPAALVTTAGFEDVLILRRQARPNLYALHPRVPPPLVDRARTLGIRGRLDGDGREVEPLEPVDAWIETHRGVLEGCAAIAICLLHSYACPDHEARLAGALRAAFPGVPVTVSSELVPLSREYERAATCAVNATLGPVMGRYLERLGERAAPTPVRVMGSSGGLMPAARAAREPVHTVLSGPAGGVRGAWLAGRRCGRSDLLALDMGGTSADVSVVQGALQPEDEGHLAEHPLRVPLLPIESVGAGGGSIAWIDAGGALRVGPQSAGAVPGPAAYGRAGDDAAATVTDANVVLGRIRELLGGAMELDAVAARAAVARLAARLGTGLEETAQAVIAIAESTMARACKRVSMERGIDPRRLTLVAFGGAGGLHACALADELGCRDVLFPREPGVLSAEGILGAPAEASAVRSVHWDETQWEAERIAAAVGGTAAEAVDRVRREAPGAGEPTVRVWLDCRYRGQSFSLPVVANAVAAAIGAASGSSDGTDDAGLTGDLGILAAGLRTAFELAHRERYGYALGPATPVELVAIRAFAQSGAAALERETQMADGREDGGEDAGHDAGEDGGTTDGDAWLCGPRAVATYSATLWIPAHWRARRLASGDILCERTRDGGELPGAGERHDVLALEVHRQRLSAIAEEMGAALMRASFSANIKERRDFSCALFDSAGRMLVQAAHIPVHLGSQQLSVEAAVAAVPMRRGLCVILNDPYAGGTHLPDVTLVAPVHLDGDPDERPSYYVANRAHHADIGGTQPGSMPVGPNGGVHGTVLHIDDEGWRSPAVPLTDAVRDDFARTSRTPQERYGDLRAQEAANHVGAERLRQLAAALPDSVSHDLNAALLDYTERRMRAVLTALPDGVYAFEDVLDVAGADGRPLRLPVRLHIEGDTARVDFSGAPPQVPSSLNAVRAIAVSAVFYVLRCLGGETMPSNAGLLRPVEVVTRPGTICDAVYPAAVAAGNVETSQRLVDLLFGALAQAAPDRVPAASCGTMSNVLFGGVAPDGRVFVHYETLAGGAGGGPDGAGAHAIQTHMTNTLNTPCEELERAYPLRLQRYAVRRGSGGDGAHPGGDGIVRAYTFGVPVDVTVLSERRLAAPWGLAGGGPGAPGVNRVERAGGRVEHLGPRAEVHLDAGDTLVIETPGGGGWGAPRK